MLNMYIDTYGDAVHTQMAGDTQRHISIHPIDPDQHTPENESVTPDSPVRGAVSRIGESEGLGSSMDAPGACTYVQSTASDSRTPAHASEYLETCQITLTHLVEAQKRAQEPERLGNPLCASGMRTHEHSDRIDAKKA